MYHPAYLDPFLTIFNRPLSALSLSLPSTPQGLQAIRCPAGLFFDIEKQTCDWKDAVKNCKSKNRERKIKPLLITDEPLCQDGFLACGDGSCIERGLFCNGEKDCNDGSDENSCGKCSKRSQRLPHGLITRSRSANRGSRGGLVIGQSTSGAPCLDLIEIWRARTHTEIQVPRHYPPGNSRHARRSDGQTNIYTRTKAKFCLEIPTDVGELGVA